MKNELLLLASFCLVSACGPMIEKRFFPKPGPEELSKEVDRLSATEVKNYSPKPVAPGSLWPADDHVFFYADRKALRVGDIVTISIVENAKANNTADTDLSRTSSISASLS